MSQLTTRQRILDWFTFTPEHVTDDLARYYIYWKVFYVLAALGHFMTLVLFWQTGVTIMAVFNVFSVAIFVSALMLLERGYYQTAFWAAITELVLHGIAATICVGHQYSFQNYPFLVVILLFIQPFYSMRSSILMAAAILLSAALVMSYAVSNQPLYLMPEDQQAMLAAVPMISWPFYVLLMVLPFVRASARAEQEIAAAYGESERLLLNILPAPIAERLKTTQGMIADDHDKVAILFADIVGFTEMSGRLKPTELVSLLNDVFNAIDGVVAKYGAEKIKTIGDAYMVVAGLPLADPDPDATIAQLALEMADVVSCFKDPVTGDPVQIRIGINSGAVVAGVIGNRKFAYDLWGDAVNLAARMEVTCEVGRIQAPQALAHSLRDRFAFEPRGEVEIKGKGKMRTAYLTGRLGDAHRPSHDQYVAKPD
ncbi:MAG: adenylate/guanylate cyclase domain-containing protein [Pseudomonadota bacterium]